MVHNIIIIERLINKEVLYNYNMAKIQITEDKKTGQVKYYTYLPSDIMKNLVVAKGDSLLLKSVVGDEITFKLVRSQ
jgi:hypothetical protein